MLNNTWPNLFSNVAHFWNSSLSNSSFTLFSNVAHFWNSSLSNSSFKWNSSLPNSNSKHYIWSNCHNAWNLSLANSSLTNVLHYWISLTWFFFLNISKIQAVWQKMPPKLCLINRIIIKKKNTCSKLRKQQLQNYDPRMWTWGVYVMLIAYDGPHEYAYKFSDLKEYWSLGLI